jgi:hypothetical protein
MDGLSVDMGIHYEISSGTLLGAVKLNNYLPWDIDGELFVQSEKMHLLRPGRRGHDVLDEAGIKTGSHKEDAYWDKGAGYMTMHHRGTNGQESHVNTLKSF